MLATELLRDKKQRWSLLWGLFALVVASLIFLKRNDNFAASSAAEIVIIPTVTPILALPAWPELPIEISEIPIQTTQSEVVVTSTPTFENGPVWVFPQTPEPPPQATPTPILPFSPLIGLPVAGKITQGFGCSLYYTGFLGPGCPNEQRWFHDGLDIGVAAGTLVHSVIPGTVIFAGPDPSGPKCGDEDDYRGYGLAVVVDSGTGWQALYAHLSSLDVAIDEVIPTGVSIGRTGDSGCATGPHLHFAMKYKGDLVDPRLYLPETK